jgi:hypothetical protein
MLILQAQEFISLLHSLLDTVSKTRKMSGPGRVTGPHAHPCIFVRPRGGPSV